MNIAEHEDELRELKQIAESAGVSFERMPNESSPHLGGIIVSTGGPGSIEYNSLPHLRDYVHNHVIAERVANLIPDETEEDVKAFAIRVN